MRSADFKPSAAGIAELVTANNRLTHEMLERSLRRGGSIARTESQWTSEGTKVLRVTFTTLMRKGT